MKRQGWLRRLAGGWMVLITWSILCCRAVALPLEPAVQEAFQSDYAEVWFSFLMEQVDPLDRPAGSGFVVGFTSDDYLSISNAPTLGTDQIGFGIRSTADGSELVLADWYGASERLSKGRVAYAGESVYILGRIQLKPYGVEDTLTVWKLLPGATDLSAESKTSFSLNLRQNLLDRIAVHEIGRSSIGALRVAAVEHAETAHDALARVLPELQLTMPELFFTVTDRNEADVSGQTLIDSDAIHIVTESARPVSTYRFQLLEQSSEPTASQWAGAPLEPFFEDLYFYRRPTTQWIRLTVSDDAGHTKTRTYGLQGGTLSAPVDDPTDPWEYVGRLGYGFAFAEFSRGVESKYESDTFFANYKRGGFRTLRLFAGKGPDNSNFFTSWEHVADELEDCLTVMLRHGLFPIVTQGFEYEDQPDYKTVGADFYSLIGPRLKYYSHRLSFEPHIEISSNEGMREIDPISGLYENLMEVNANIATAIRAHTPTHNIVFSNANNNDPYNLAQQIPPTEAGDYFFYHWHSWASGIDGGINGLPQWTVGASPRERDVFSKPMDWARNFCLSNGIPYRFSAINPSVNRYDSATYPTDMADWINFMNADHQQAPDGRKIRVPLTWQNLDSETYFDDEQAMDWNYNPHYAFITEALNGPAVIWPNDRDGDGLSNEEELTRGTDPDHPDSDRDNMPDGLEVDFGFNPLDRTDGDPDVAWGTTDFDGDGIADNDADGDGAPNARELQWTIALNDPLTGTHIPSEWLMSPFDPTDVRIDGDGDGILNGDEILTRSFIHRWSGNDFIEPSLDRDDDGLTLLWEVIYGLNAKTNNSIGSIIDGTQDSDYDGLSDLDEHDGVTHPWVSDIGHLQRYRFDSKTAPTKNDAPGGSGGNAQLGGNAITNRVLDANWNRMQRARNRKVSAFTENGMEVWPERQQALFLDGVGSYLSLDQTALTTAPVEERTIMFYYRPANLQSGTQILYEEGNETSGLSIIQNADALRACAWNGATVREAVLPLPLLLGHWHHIGLTLDTDALQLYYNGSLAALEPGLTLPATGANVTLGGSAQNELTRTAPNTLESGCWATGWFDDLCIYNRTLSAAEFSHLKMAQIRNRTLEEGLMANRRAGETHWLDYTFENQAADSAPHGGNLSGTLKNGASTQYSAARNGWVLSVDGLNDYVAIPPILFQAEDKSARTIAFAFNASTISPEYQVIFHEGHKDCFTVYLYRNELWFIWSDSVSLSTYARIGTVTPGTWHDVLIEVVVPTGFLDENEGRVHAYFDQRLTHTGPITFTVAADTSRKVTLGGGPNTARLHHPSGGIQNISGRYFRGLIDDFNLYRDLVSQRPSLPQNLDFDGDGLANTIDPDDDNDTVPDATDPFPLNPAEWLDSDGDGIGNNADPDDDNDGVLDPDDDFPLDPNRWIDHAPRFEVVEDSFSNSRKPTDTYGAEPTLSLKKNGKYPYLKFEIPNLPGIVTQAVLHVYALTESDSVEARAVADNHWAEATLNWDNAPAPGARIGLGQAVANGWFPIDITGYITQTGTWSLALNELGNSFGTAASKESGKPPYLELKTIGYTLDSDGDGMSDADEWLAGTNPHDPSDLFRVISFAPTQTDIYTIEWSTIPGRNYTLWSTPDLHTGTWAQIHVPLTAITNRLSTPVTNPAPKMFYRVSVENP